MAMAIAIVIVLLFLLLAGRGVKAEKKDMEMIAKEVLGGKI